MGRSPLYLCSRNAKGVTIRYQGPLSRVLVTTHSTYTTELNPSPSVVVSVIAKRWWGLVYTYTSVRSTGAVVTLAWIRRWNVSKSAVSVSVH